MSGMAAKGVTVVVSRSESVVRARPQALRRPLGCLELADEYHSVAFRRHAQQKEEEDRIHARAAAAVEPWEVAGAVVSVEGRRDRRCQGTAMLKARKPA